LLWACNVAAPLLALGCFFGVRMACAIALSWLSFGTPVWLIDLANGKNMILTSPMVHVVAPIIAVLALRELGWPKRGWLAASAASIALFVVTLLFGTPRTNVNLAFRVQDGWERIFPSHVSFLGGIFALSSLVFFGVDALCTWLIGPKFER
jgi:hypothetical protein